jgi:AraC family transcriptional regulator, transcriptional activator of the genes for pyochelin and ferripyochelin receptors
MSPKGFTDDEIQRIAVVKTYLHNQLYMRFTIRELARKAALGEQRFKECFYRVYERNVGEYIHETRMQTGKFLLSNTNKSVKEIASLCGYSKTRNFSSAYKKFFGVSPSGARN